MGALSGGLRKRLRLCPYCASPLPDYRLGIKLTPLKARIFDLIQWAGDHGVPMRDLQNIVGLNYNCLKSHIYQINEAINGRGYRLYGRGGAVRLIRTPPPPCADATLARKRRKA